MKNIETIKEEHHELAKAIKFLVDRVLDANGEQKLNVRTSKPLVIHSLETAFYLKNLGYDNEIVIAAVLHDLLEDTETEKSEIEKKFGTKIVEIVEAVSYDYGINKDADYRKNYDKMADFREALIIKAADILENLKYFKFTAKEENSRLLQKWNYFLQIAQNISEEPVYKELKNNMIKLK